VKHKTLYTFLLLALLLNACLQQTPQPIPQKDIRLEYLHKPKIQTRGVQQNQKFISTIHLALNSTLSKDPSASIGMRMCATSIEDIKRQYNTLLPQDSKVRRTAIKYRNPNNQPDEVDRKVMEEMITTNNLNSPVVVSVQDHYRIYTPIITQDSCLICHGDQDHLSPKIKSIIKEYYPNDLAINFKIGELRGVVVSEIQKKRQLPTQN
jgi:hypothetical protein